MKPKITLQVQTGPAFPKNTLTVYRGNACVRVKISKQSAAALIKLGVDSEG